MGNCSSDPSSSLSPRANPTTTTPAAATAAADASGADPGNSAASRSTAEETEASVDPYAEFRPATPYLITLPEPSASFQYEAATDDSMDKLLQQALQEMDAETFMGQITKLPGKHRFSMFGESVCLFQRSCMGAAVQEITKPPDRDAVEYGSDGRSEPSVSDDTENRSGSGSISRDLVIKTDMLNANGEYWISLLDFVRDRRPFMIGSEFRRNILKRVEEYNNRPRGKSGR